MANSILHIKDSFYFEVPKPLWRSQRESMSDFPDWWVRLDADYQLWEAEQIYHSLEKIVPQGQLPQWDTLKNEYVHWKDADHARFGRPFSSFLEEDPHQEWFASLKASESFQESWAAVKSNTAHRLDAYPGKWSAEKIEGYNHALDGKILIPQLPGATLRNAYQAESGFCVSKFMILELLASLVLVLVFSWLGNKIRGGAAPKGRLWNMLEAVVVYIRNDVVRPAVGEHDAHRFLPLLWTIFFFVLVCNLFGMLPWLGAPTSSFGVTLTLAGAIFITVWISGMRKMGPLGFFKNLMPDIDLGSFALNIAIALPLRLFILVIELFGLCVKHAVLGVRLLANMVAGHLVLLGIMGMAFSLEAVIEMTTVQWSVTAAVSVLASAAFSCLELFVAFLQAYVFTFLSALFIGSAIHKH